jgi:hypothetical protein
MLPEAKRAALSTCPLSEPGVLRLILSLVGPGNGVFTAAVSAAWAAAYREVLAESADASDPVVCSTFSSAAFSSASRLRWAHDGGMPLSAEKQWARLGRIADVETLAAAHELFEPCVAAVVQGAAESGCLVKLSWLHCQHSSCCQFLHDAALEEAGDAFFAVALGEQEVEVASDCFYSEQVIAAAAGAGHVHVLSYMREHGCTLLESACMGAAAGGQIAVLRWLREVGCAWATSGPPKLRIATAAAEGGSVEVMQFLHEQGVPFDESAMVSAAAGGHLPVCKFLGSLQCPCNEMCCNAAAHWGHVQVLQWLCRQGCPCKPGDLARWAGTGGSIATIAHVAAAAAPARRARALQLMLNYAGGHNHLAAAQWLRAQGAEWPAVLRCTVRFGAQQTVAVWSGSVLEWARAEGCTAPTHVENGAAPAQNVPAPAQNGAAPPAPIIPAAPLAV